MQIPQVAFTEVLGQVIKNRRQASKTKQEIVASYLEISPSAWSRIEAGHTSMTVPQLRQTAQALGTTAWHLLKDAEEMVERIRETNPEIQVVHERPKGAAATSPSTANLAGWFLGGAAVGALIASLASSPKRSAKDE